MSILKLIKKNNKSIIIGNIYSKEPIKIVHSNVLTSSLKHKFNLNDFKYYKPFKENK